MFVSSRAFHAKVCQIRLDNFQTFRQCDKIIMQILQKCTILCIRTKILETGKVEQISEI